MPFVCLLRKLFILWHFHFQMSNSMLHVMFGVLVQHQMCFASMNFHLVCVVYLWKQCFSVLLSTTHFCMHHVFCWPLNFMPQHIKNLLMSIFIGIIQNCSQCNQMLSNMVKTLNLFFYNMMSFSGHPVCCLGLSWCILLGMFYVLLPNLWFG